MINLKPISKINVVDTIIEIFSEMIINKSMQTGERFPSELELTKRLGVGRSSVREALKALETLGLIDRGPRGVFVAEPGDDFLYKPFGFLIALRDIDMQEIYEMRLYLEVANAELAAIRAEKRHLEDIYYWIEKTASLPPEEALNVSVNFHHAIAKATQNRVAIEISKSFKLLLLKSVRRTHAMPEQQQGDHRKIYEAIKEKDSKKAGRYMEEHLRSVYSL